MTFRPADTANRRPTDPRTAALRGPIRSAALPGTTPRTAALPAAHPRAASSRTAFLRPADLRAASRRTASHVASVPGARAALAALATAAIMALVVGAVGALRQPVDHGGGVLSDGDRRALAAAPALRGPDGGAPDPRVDLTDSAAAARAYLVAAYSGQPADAGHTQRRGTPYAQPGSPAADVGVVVLDPPGPGTVRTATVTGLGPAGAADNRRGYRAQLSLHTGAPGGPEAVAVVHTLVVLAEQPDGRWLVTADTAEGAVDPDFPGED